MASYPGIGELSARRWLAAHAADPSATPPEAESMGRGDAVSVEAGLDDVAARFGALLTEPGAGADPDRVEGLLAGPLFEVLGEVPPEVIDDPSFWRWVGIAKLWRFVHWRESAAFANEASAYLKYVDGRRTTECVVIRTFLRGRICASIGEPGLAAAIERGTDLWRSHIIRVRTSRAPELAGALVRAQIDDRSAAPALRASVRRLNRDMTNLIPTLVDRPTAVRLVTEAWRSGTEDGR